MIMNTMRIRLLAGAAVVGLTLGAAACADGDDTADSAPGTSAPASAEETDAGAEEDAGAAEEDADESTQRAAGEQEDQPQTEEVETTDGNIALVPADLAAGVAERDDAWGKPETVQQFGETMIATYGNGDRLVHSPETGTVELVGMIGRAWDDQGGPEGEVGLPVNAEEEVDNGWTQDFQNGTISYTDDGTGNYQEHVDTA